MCFKTIVPLFLGIIIRKSARKSGDPPFENVGDCRKMESEEGVFRTKEIIKSDGNIPKK